MQAPKLLVALAILGSASAASTERAETDSCDLRVQEIVNSEEVKQAPNPLERALSAVRQEALGHCTNEHPSYIGAQAYFLYGLGRINESEQLIRRIDWQKSRKLIVLRTATILIVHEQRLGGDLREAEALARVIVESAPADPKSHLLLGEALIAQSRSREAVAAYDAARRSRIDGGLREVNGFDLNFIPSLFEQERFEDALSIFNAARENPSYGIGFYPVSADGLIKA